MITHSVENGLSLVVMDRPEKKNALTGDMYTGLAEILETGNERDDIRCHLLTGSGGIFTSGNDIADFIRMASGGDLTGTPVLRFLKALTFNHKPLVAAVEGVAVGVGTTMLLHCDMVFAAPTATFHTPFVDLGLVPEAGASLLGPAVMGPARAFELLAFGEPFDALRAREAGLVNHVSDQALEDARRCAIALCHKPPEALRLARDLIRGNPEVLWQRVAEEAEIFAKRLKSPETQAAFQAFMSRKATR